MARLRSPIPYEILHGISPSLNISSMLAYLSYFPPPPPVIPAPPPRRSWTCFTDPQSSCFMSDDLNPFYIPPRKSNHSILSNNTSHLSTTTHTNAKSFSLMNFFQNQLTLILLLIIFLSIFIFFLLLLFLFLYFQRLRRRSASSSSHRHVQTNNNTNNLNNNFELNEKKNSVFYSRLMPYHRKRSTTCRNPSDGKNVLRLSNHDSPVLPVKRLSGLHINTSNEQEAVL